MSWYQNSVLCDFLSVKYYKLKRFNNTLLFPVASSRRPETLVSSIKEITIGP